MEAIDRSDVMFQASTETGTDSDFIDGGIVERSNVFCSSIGSLGMGCEHEKEEWIVDMVLPMRYELFVPRHPDMTLMRGASYVP